VTLVTVIAGKHWNLCILVVSILRWAARVLSFLVVKNVLNLS
jgi:hypothetical protein